MSADLTHWCGVFVEFEQAKKYPGDCTKKKKKKKFPADLVTFAEEILNGKLCFLSSGK